MAETAPTQQEVDFGKQADVFVAHFAKVYPLDSIKDALSSALVNAVAGVMDGLLRGAESLAGRVGKVLPALEEPMLPILGAFVAPTIAGMFGTEAGAGAFARRDSGGERSDAAKALVDGFIAAIVGDADGPQEPSDAGARRIAAAGVHAAIEGWFNAFIAENIADLMPDDWLHIHGVTELPEEVISALGVSRLIRRALGPLVNATAVQPLTWATNKKYRPTKLPAPTIARQLARGAMDVDRAFELLARDGYRDEDIQAVLNDYIKFQAVGDLELLVRLGELSTDEAIQELRDAGWDEDRARSQFTLERFKRLESFENDMATAAIAAYASRLIDDDKLNTFTDGTSFDAQHRSQLRELAATRRALRIQYLSSTQAEACVKGGILPFSEYRAALAREGYVDDAIDALEMLLRKALDDKATLDDLKARQLADKQAAAQEKADAVAAKKAEIDAANALKRRGAIGTLEDAVVKGLIPMSRLAEVLAAQFDADTVAIYTADVDAKRLAFLAQQQKADDAAKRANNKGLSIGELQDALTAGYLTASELRARLVTSGLNSDDVAVLLQVMQQKAADGAAAKALHEQAVSRAAKKTITLQQADALARAGHWTIAQYQAFVRGLGYQDADAASLTALLSDAIAKDAAARALREKTGADNPQRGLTLEQFRNAVLSGSKTIEDFAQFLTAANYNADAIAVLVPELQDAVAAADAARARRDRTDTALHGRELSVSDLARAAQLGFLSPADYQAALVARGYSAADVALELDLLVAETATKKTPAPAAGTVEALVAAGIGSPLVVATARRADVAATLAAAGASLDEIEGRVAAGALTLDAYTAMLADRGVDALDVELLRALLVATLTKAPEKAK
jgi:hypothetical protein